MNDHSVIGTLQSESAGIAAIEDAIVKHPRVAHAAVVIFEDEDEYEQLIAYAVPVVGCRTLTASEICAYVAEQQPGYAVPDAVVFLEELPLTASGETDLAALPEAWLAADAGGFPRTLREEVLCELFAAVLDLPVVGVDDDFFELGGHSLLATRLVTRIRSVMRVELGVRDVFEAPTARGLAEVMVGRRSRRPEIERTERPDRVPASVSQQRLWSAEQLDSTSSLNPRAIAFRLSGPLDTEALRAALEDIAGRHEALRTRYQDFAGVLHQVIMDRAADQKFEVIAVTEQDLPGALTEAAAKRPDLATNPPWRTTLFELGREEFALLLVFHRIAADDWSIGVLKRDLTRAYAARLAGHAPVWELLAVQPADYTLWQQGLLGDEGDPRSLAACQLGYWREALADLPDVLALPTDRPYPDTTGNRAAAVPLKIPPELHARLRAVARQHKATVFMVLQAGFGALLTRLGAGRTIPIGTPVTGRVDASLDSVVGLFRNTLVHRVDTTGDPAFGELVARVRDTALAAHDHQDMSFDRLVGALGPYRSLFQVSMELQNTPDSTLRLPGLSVTDITVGTDDAEFELAVTMRESFDEQKAPKGVHGELAYRTDLFDRATAERIGASFIRLLESAVADPELPIGVLEIADKSKWNEVQPGPPTNRPVREAISMRTTAGLLERVVSLHSGTNDRPLFCVPPITGLSWTYAALLPHLDGEYPIYGLQAGGITATSVRPATMCELAADYAAHIRTIQPQGPYRLLGWSVGGLIAQAIATHLQGEGEEIALLALIDAYPISAQWGPSGPHDEDDFETSALIAMLSSIEGTEVSDSTDVQRSAVIERFRDTLSLSENEASDLVSAALHSARLARTHVPERFTGRVVFFNATIRGPLKLTPAAWNPYVDGRVEVHQVAGEHYELLRPLAAAAIGRVLTAELVAERGDRPS